MFNSPSVANDTFGNRLEITDKTDIPDNAAFIAAVFHTLPDPAAATVTSFGGNPAKATAKDWGCYAPVGKIATPNEANNYFCISSHFPGDDGIVRRRKTHFAGLHCIMLDDVGTKVPEERITLAPSWKIETSPGNYQVGFILNQPITEAAAADRLMNAIIASGLCDPGANGPTSRNARLPIAINGKHDPLFHCRMTEWAPTLHYSPEDIVTGLEVELAPAGRPKREKKGRKILDTGSPDDVFLPAPTENPVIAELKKRGLYKQPLGSGKHDITCPWVHEHTDALDHGSCYFEPDDLFPIGGFKCLHGHGEKLRVTSLLEHLGVAVGNARMKPTIRVAAGELHRIVDRAEQELSKCGKHYQRGGLIVSISSDPTTNESAIVPTSLPALTRALSASAMWERFDSRADDWLRSDPPARHVSVLFDSQNYDHLPILNGIARQPFLRTSGSIVSMPGYDSDTGMFGVFDARLFSIPENPTKEQAAESLARLASLLDEFSFTADCDKAAALALLLTAAVRPSLAHAPMFHAKAPVMGSGKSFLGKLATAIATPASPSPVSFPDSEEECGKLLLSLLLKSPPVIEFDDLSSDIMPYDKLKTAITEESITGRILGVSKEATVSTRTLFISSGNNVGPIADMTRRVLTINIDPMCASPATRKFKRPHLLTEVRANRAKHVSDALTIARAWIVAGRPEASIPPVASFTDWSGLCRHSLVWLGLPDPATTLFTQMADDPDAETLGRLLSGWFEIFGTGPVMTRDLVAKIDSHPTSDLTAVLRDIAEERGGFINRNRLGRWVRRHEGRFVSDMRIIPDSNGRNAKAWRLSVSSVSSAFSSQAAKVSARTQGVL